MTGLIIAAGLAARCQVTGLSCRNSCYRCQVTGLIIAAGLAARCQVTELIIAAGLAAIDAK